MVVGLLMVFVLRILFLLIFLLSIGDICLRLIGLIGLYCLIGLQGVICLYRLICLAGLVGLIGLIGLLREATLTVTLTHLRNL